MVGIREGLPMMLGAAVPLLAPALMRGALLAHQRLLATAVLSILVGITASTVNGELPAGTEGLFPITVDSALAFVGALACARLVRR